MSMQATQRCCRWIFALVIIDRPATPPCTQGRKSKPSTRRSNARWILFSGLDGTEKVRPSFSISLKCRSARLVRRTKSQFGSAIFRATSSDERIPIIHFSGNPNFFIKQTAATEGTSDSSGPDDTTYVPPPLRGVARPGRTVSRASGELRPIPAVMPALGSARSRYRVPAMLA